MTRTGRAEPDADLRYLEKGRKRPPAGVKKAPGREDDSNDDRPPTMMKSGGKRISKNDIGLRAKMAPSRASKYTCKGSMKTSLPAEPEVVPDRDRDKKRMPGE